jgi:C4-dicarboxylate-specific signal transduction histidine kinase
MADTILTLFTEEEFRTSAIIKDFYVYYKVAPIAIFLFLHFAIYYLRRLNWRYENEINEYNAELNATIEELKLTQQHLIQAEKMAALGTLTAGVAHEINNPLNFIGGGMELILEVEEEVNQHFSTDQKKRFEGASKLVQSGFERVSGIVKALMSFSSGSKPRLILADINKIIENTLLFLSSKMPENIVLEKNFHFRGKTKIYVDRIHQVIISIVANAIDAVKENKKKEKKIWITTRKEGSELVIEIANNGPQIPTENLNNLFDPFYTTKDPGKGMGLGLSIAYSFINEQNGTIVGKNIDKGVSFIIRIPFSDR